MPYRPFEFQYYRGYGWFSFRYWWFNYILWILIGAVLLYFLILKDNSQYGPVESDLKLDSLITQINSQLKNCCNCQDSLGLINTPNTDTLQRDSAIQPVITRPPVHRAEPPSSPPTEEEIINEIQEELDSLAAQIYFNGGTTEIRDFSKDKIDQIVKLLQENPSLRVSVTGYQNEDPNSPYVNVSYNRAYKIKTLLMNQGISGGRIEVIDGGISRDFPQETFEDEFGNRHNRNMRVEIKIL